MRVIALIPLLLLAAFAATGATAPAEDPALAAAMGRTTYRLSCASCHGADAKGNGPVAEYLKVPPADLTKITARNGGEFPKDRVRASIDGREPARGHGSSDMPVWGNVFESSHGSEAANQKIDELVAFVALIQAE